MKKLSRYIPIAATALFLSLGLHAQDYGTGAISTATGDELYKRVESNFSNTFTGAFNGLTVLHGSGEMGNNDARYLIRGMGSYGVGSWSQAKIFVDGFEVERDFMVSLSPAEIEKVEILKDAAALVLYGERGANGVIRITTRRGEIGKPSVNARVRYGVQTPALLNKPLDAYEYASLYNQAVSNDNGMYWSPVYSEEQLEAFRDGTAPNVDWYKEALRSAGHFVDADLFLHGGVKAARYSVNLNYLGNWGLMNTQKTDATRNLGYNRFNVRGNLDFDILKIFEVRLDIAGRIELLHRPNYSIPQLFTDLARYPSNIYNVFDDDAREHYSGTAVYPNNPYGSVEGLGWAQGKARSLQTNLVVREKLDVLTEGLYLEEAFSFYGYTLSTYSKSRDYARWHDGATTTTNETTSIVASGYGSAGMQDWKQGRITAAYDRAFGGHNINACANFNLSAYKGDGYFNYKYNTLNVNGLARYDYAHRYIAEFGFSCFGSDAFAPGHRWHFYPALSAAWVASEEPFLKNSSAVQFLKVRASVGLNGTSDSGATSVLSDFDSNGRYLFKNYYTYSYIGSFYTGATNPEWQSTLVPMFVSNENIRPEKSLKANLGVDADLFGGLHLSADAFIDNRTDILTLDHSQMGYYGKQFMFSNIGRMLSYGVEFAASYSGKSGDWAWNFGGTIAWTRNIVKEMGEVAPAHSYNAATGRPYGTYIGLVADGFYDISDFDDDGKLLETLPTPAFGAVQPGDIKYLDLDKNGIVDQNDVTKVGRSWVPEWTFTLGGKVCWRGVDLEIAFQGVAGVSAYLLDNWNQNVAFVDNGNAYAIARGAWAYYPVNGIDNRAGATYPRLTTRSNENNYRTSSFWVKDASFLKLRNLEIGYTWKDKFRVFINGQNLFTISPLQRKYNIDPENIKGLYPQLRTFNTGISVNF